MALEGLRPLEAKNYLKRLKPGCLLLSQKTMADPNFSESIVLICHYNSDGAYGLVLNRASHMPLSEIFNSLDFHQKGVKRVFIGGPVQEAELQIIQFTNEPAPDATKLSAKVYLGGQWDEMDKLLSLNPPEIRLFLGYSGWASKQLEMEIQAGGWEVYQTDLDSLFANETAPWEKKGFAAFREQLMVESGDI